MGADALDEVSGVGAGAFDDGNGSGEGAFVSGQEVGYELGVGHFDCRLTLLSDSSILALSHPPAHTSTKLSTSGPTPPCAYFDPVCSIQIAYLPRSYFD